MSEPVSFEQLKAAIENVLGSETDDVKVLAETLGLNISQDFAGADLKNVDFSGHDLSQANFEDSDLSGANLRGVNLTYANLKGSVLFDACLNNANLSFADLRGADLQNASVDGANFFGVNVDELTKSSLNQLCIEAVRLRRPAIEMRLEFEDRGQHEASLLNLSEIFKAFQASLTCFGQALQLIRTGNIPENISELTKANAFAFFPGSFGIKIVTGHRDHEVEQFNLLEGSFSEDVLEEFFNILNSARDRHKLQEDLLRLRHGTPKVFRNFIKKFDDAQSGLSISWNSPSNPGKGGFARLRQSEIESVIESIDEVDSEDYEIIELDDVKLISANDETKSFIIRDMSIKDKKKSKLKGYISKEALALADQSNESLEIGKKYNVKLRKIIKSFVLIEDIEIEYEMAEFRRKSSANAQE